ncbi:MAG: PD40 domain-containing protein [Balneolaceae bacterium]|nr:PD40 domain-containing protein [Balneolaceae bacterium]
MSFRLPILLLFLTFITQSLFAQETKLVRQPDISNNQIVFAYGNDLWVVSSDGGEAERLTSFQGSETHPNFSPDGSMVAFTGQYDGNTDVYIVPTEGGEPKRLTWHPDNDVVRGWSPDGQYVIFESSRTGAPVSVGKFWKVTREGTFPEALPIPRGHRGDYSPDGNYFAYQQVDQSDEEWRNYRGGQNRPIWVMDMSDYTIDKLPWDGSNDQNPSWMGDKIYFMSDRDYAMNVYSYDRASNELQQLTHHSEYDVKELSAGDGMLVYENGGSIYKLNPENGRPEKVSITVNGDFPWARPHWEEVGDRITNAELSPTGVRAVVQARGEIFTIPTDKGDYRNLTNSSGAADRHPSWSPDGQHIAWFSDKSGEYQLMIGSQDGMDKPRAINIPNPTFFYRTAWSPDSEKILFTDEGLNLYYVDVASGDLTRIDNDTYAHPQRTLDPEWSPDSKWIAYSKRLENQFHVIKAYSLEEDQAYQITDGLSDAISPAWDASGDYLFFLASTNFALNTGWLDMSSYDRPVERGIYFAVLKDQQPSPLLPESDEEKVKTENGEGDAGDKEEEPKNTEVTIDFNGIDQRILSLDVPERNYIELNAGQKGQLFYGELVENQPGITLHKYTLKERKTEHFMAPLQYYTLSHDGKKLLYQSGDTWGVVPTKKPAEIGNGKLNTNLRMKLDPQKEWRQIFDEAWRFERDYFYVENLHGADWDAVYKKYSPWVDHVRHRSDLTYLLDILGGELSVGHSFTGGGDEPDVDNVSIGLLGADLEITNGRYRIKRIYNGENWNPNLRAPLRAPGIDVQEGDYLLAVNGNELTADMNPYSLFAGQAERQTVITVNDEPSLDGAEDVTVVPVDDEGALRSRAWVESNRRKVNEMSNGKLAYVWLPNTSNAGYDYFNRYYFAQQDKKGAVIDERFNGGGSAADYMIDIMSRELHGFFNNPVGDNTPFPSPGAGIWGPKVMIINESAGSGGDYLPYMFKKENIGPLVGRTTWGGLVGIWDTPPLIDGGGITAPRGGFYNLDGEWAVENEGVEPDIKVEMTPKAVINGGDPQLERAVEKAMELLEETPDMIVPQPEDPVRVKRPDNSGSDG